MDFFQIQTKERKDGRLDVYPNFHVGRSEDLMIRGGAFYAIWDEEAGLWSTDEYDVVRLVDAELYKYADELKEGGAFPVVKAMRSFRSKSWVEFKRFVTSMSDNSVQLDQTLTFANSEVSKEDHVSKRLPYSLEDGDFSAWDELVGELYYLDERAKLEWAIGSVVAGDSKHIQKFFVLYGPAGTGKSTVLDIIAKLFTGYTTTFDAKALGSASSSFATEAFKDNPLVAIQHDGDLSKIDDNTRLNSIVSHEMMLMNEKFKASYSAKTNALLFIGTNQPVKISDAKSGLIRRLIDVSPTGDHIPVNRYQALLSRINFELGAIAKHCLDVYLQMGRNYYSGYQPLEMMLQTDVFFNFIEAYFDVFKDQDGVTLKQAYVMYKEFCDETGINRVEPMYKVREELRNYFDEFHDRLTVNGTTVRSYYEGFSAKPFKQKEEDAAAFSLVMEESESIFDTEYAHLPAQYAKEDGTPETYWNEVETTLGDLDTSKLHYVNLPENHIVIDFDLEGKDGGRDLERNLRAASAWPPTYGEYSQSGGGVHLHYIYAGGDPKELAANHSPGVEVKTFPGGASLRRRFTSANSLDVARLSEGTLPLKESTVSDANTMKNEKSLRDLISRNLRKEIHPGTKPSVDFIKKILDDAYASDMVYDVSDMRSTILAFANNSTHQALTCLKTVQQMKFQSEEKSLDISDNPSEDDPLAFYDVEVFPNLFVVCWKYEGKDTNVVKMINPSPAEIEQLFKLKLVGFNNRRYDNHILWARLMGFNNEQLYRLSQKIIVERDHNAMFGEAYGASYADIYDFSSLKQPLKKFGIQLGMHHMELDIPWDEPVPEERWDEVVGYCANDVLLTEATFENRKADFTARRILAELSGLRVNDTTARHTAKIIFGNDKNASDKFVYTDLSERFPGYEFDMGESTYREEVVGEGGYVYAEPGIYEDVVLLDIASMHPTSILVLGVFGEKYTDRFKDLVDARMAIKHGKYGQARKMLNGKLAPYLTEEDDAEALSYALKIVINIVYGLTSARFNNPFRDVRNKDNIVAKRGALFMIDLKNYIWEQGFEVVHIKTDSVKIPGATPDLIKHIQIFGDEYGYTFEHEATYDKFCLVNDAVYIAREGDKWTAVGKQFQHPYVYKKLFSGEEIAFDDMCETKSVTKGTMYLKFGEDHLHHVGRTGRFVPISGGMDGAELVRVYDGKEYAVAGTKGYLWIEAEMALADLSNIEFDENYYKELEDKAIETIEKFGSFEEFLDGKTR